MICPQGHETIWGVFATEADRAAGCIECAAGAPPFVREETPLERRRRLRRERVATLQATDAARANALVDRLREITAAETLGSSGVPGESVD